MLLEMVAVVEQVLSQVLVTQELVAMVHQA
jgi:hypothetical protein